MRYHALATDFDGTLVHNGNVTSNTIEALKKLVASGRQLVMVTGREIPDLKAVFSELNLFRWVVAENGGLLYDPATTKELVLGPAASEKLVSTLRDRGVQSISVGKSIIATWSPYEQIVLSAIRELGLELQVIFNKGAVMVLPAGVNKATGLEIALKEMKLSRHNVVGVGDAENDHSFLQIVEFSAAVSNALPGLQDAVDLILPLSHGEGVEFLIEQILADDLNSYRGASTRHKLPIGTNAFGDVELSAYSGPMLICGPSGSGKSTLTNRLVDVISEQAYQFCLVDPEGDYESFEGAVVLGGPNSEPQIDEALHVLEQPDANLVFCLTGVPIPERPAFFQQLLAGLTQLRARTGRPHWLLLDEAHHLIPADWMPSTESLPSNWMNIVLITVQPSLLPQSILKQVETVAIVGNDPKPFVEDFVSASDFEMPKLPTNEVLEGEILIWTTESPPRIQQCKALKSLRQHHRHRRKYSEGQLPPDRSFYFRGANGDMNLRAQNLILFCQLAEGIDDDTWQFHLESGDYSRWFAGSIKDDKLASAAIQIEEQKSLTPAESKKLIIDAIQRDYTLPSTPAVGLPGAS